MGSMAQHDNECWGKRSMPDAPLPHIDPPNTEQIILELVNFWCIQSLSPSEFEKWESVASSLILARKNLRGYSMKGLVGSKYLAELKNV